MIRKKCQVEDVKMASFNNHFDAAQTPDRKNYAAKAPAPPSIIIAKFIHA
jgi:hypothetical protein